MLANAMDGILVSSGSHPLNGMQENALEWPKNRVAISIPHLFVCTPCQLAEWTHSLGLQGKKLLVIRNQFCHWVETGGVAPIHLSYKGNAVWKPQRGSREHLVCEAADWKLAIPADSLTNYLILDHQKPSATLYEILPTYLVYVKKKIKITVVFLIFFFKV